jgi:hypothetical protein
VCLDILHRVLALLTPPQMQEVLGAVTAFVSHPSPVCRERMYDILMWIQDNYRLVLGCLVTHLLGLAFYLVALHHVTSMCTDFGANASSLLAQVGTKGMSLVDQLTPKLL